MVDPEMGVDRTELDRRARREFLLYLGQMTGAWQLAHEGAEVQAIAPSGASYSFKVLGSRNDVWSIRRRDVIGVQPFIPNRWWAFVSIIDDASDAEEAAASRLFLLPHSEAQRVIIGLIGVDYFTTAARDPATAVRGHIDVPVEDLLIRARGFRRPEELD